jgi:hypothetical protein
MAARQVPVLSTTAANMIKEEKFDARFTFMAVMIQVKVF